MINGWLVAGLEILREREGEVSNLNHQQFTDMYKTFDDS